MRIVVPVQLRVFSKIKMLLSGKKEGGLVTAGNASAINDAAKRQSLL